MDINEMLTKAMGIAQSVSYWVKIEGEELKEMTYLELGIFITTNADNIDEIKITLKEGLK